MFDPLSLCFYIDSFIRVYYFHIISVLIVRRRRRRRDKWQ
jgi:hypothetical protein